MEWRVDNSIELENSRIFDSKYAVRSDIWYPKAYIFDIDPINQGNLNPISDNIRIIYMISNATEDKLKNSNQISDIQI